MYMAQMQFFPLSVPMGAYPAAQGGMVYGQASANGMNNGNAVMGGAVSPSVSNPPLFCGLKCPPFIMQPYMAALCPYFVAFRLPFVGLV